MTPFCPLYVSKIGKDEANEQHHRPSHERAYSPLPSHFAMPLRNRVDCVCLLISFTHHSSAAARAIIVRFPIAPASNPARTHRRSIPGCYPNFHAGRRRLHPRHFRGTREDLFPLSGTRSSLFPTSLGGRVLRCSSKCMMCVLLRTYERPNTFSGHKILSLRASHRRVLQHENKTPRRRPSGRLPRPPLCFFPCKQLAKTRESQTLRPTPLKS